MHPEIERIKKIKRDMLNEFSGHKTKPIDIEKAIISVLDKHKFLSTYDLVFCLTPHFFKSDITKALNHLEFHHKIKRNWQEDVLSLG